MQVNKNKVVSIHYTLRAPDGRTIDTSAGREPLVYLHGNGNLISGLESALEGKQAGEKLNVKLSPENGYGLHDDKLVQAVPRGNFQGIDKIEAGMQFQANTPAGPRVVMVVDVNDEQVTVDANHPLAGIALDFDVEIKQIRDAMPEEIEHGHVHGAGGHHHGQCECGSGGCGCGCGCSSDDGSGHVH